MALREVTRARSRDTDMLQDAGKTATEVAPTPSSVAAFAALPAVAGMPIDEQLARDLQDLVDKESLGMPSLDDDVMLETILSALQSEPNVNASGPVSTLNEAFNRSRALMSANSLVAQSEEIQCGSNRTLSPLDGDQLSEPIGGPMRSLDPCQRRAQNFIGSAYLPMMIACCNDCSKTHALHCIMPIMSSSLLQAQ